MDNDRIRLLKNKNGKIVFVGSLRQIKRRFKKIFRKGPMPFLLWEAKQYGYKITNAPPKLSDVAKARYNTYMDKVKEKLKDIPHSPGVYQFKDKDGEVIYVGKAKDLRSRISQYVHEKDERPQIPYLLAEMADVSYTVVSNELESLFLENTLIKEHFPKYNIQLRDDKNYAFITIDYSCEIPQIGYARKFIPQSTAKGSASGGSKVKYFGPYSAVYKIRNTLHLLRRIFPYCAAQKVSNRPCFYYYLHRCPGVCIGKISLEEYAVQLSRIEEFLAGNTKKIRKDIEQDMKLAARGEKFETAARLRDQLQSLELLDERQSVILPRPVSWDVVSLWEDQGFACINLFKIRDGKMLDKENFTYQTTDGYKSTNDYRRETMQTFLEQYYLEASNGPKEVYIETEVDGKTAVEELLYSRFNRKIPISIPKRGKQLELINLGKKNAEEHLKHWLMSQAGHIDKINEALHELKNVLNLEKIPERIECYDISNIQGTNPVGSMVVFEKGLPKKSEYRKFKIRSKSTPDDFTMMKEMLTRRFQRIEGKSQDPNNKSQTNSSAKTSKFKTSWPQPDLIVIDGGKGQLNAALEVLDKFQMPNDELQIIGLAKRIEEIFLPKKSESIILSHNNPGLQLLQRLRDEAHRFGITFHRDLRSKQAVKSALDDVPGIGPKTKKLLKTKFGTVSNIRKASPEELTALVGEKLAEQIKKYL